jgi:hypothetical protein
MLVVSEIFFFTAKTQRFYREICFPNDAHSSFKIAIAGQTEEEPARYRRWYRPLCLLKAKINQELFSSARA